MPYSNYPFELLPLPYSYDALEPSIDARTVILHHDKYLKTYVTNLNKILSTRPEYQNWSLTDLIIRAPSLPAEIQIPIQNNAGGVYNHNLYFSVMQPPQNQFPGKKLGEAILSSSFGSFEAFIAGFKAHAIAVFGSGYAWLVCTSSGKLSMMITPNQNTPPLLKVNPILLIDVWEHAYYLKYQNMRADYIDNWWNIVNWEEAEKNYLECIGKYR